MSDLNFIAREVTENVKKSMDFAVFLASVARLSGQ